ncbi:MAG: hypothetical protein ACLQQ4_06595 [Bacteroidia bacterium]
MTTKVKTPKAKKTISPQDVKKIISGHEIAAMHHEAAAKHHREAARRSESGDHKKANKSTIKAHDHSCLACEAQKEYSKHHTLKN